MHELVGRGEGSRQKGSEERFVLQIVGQSILDLLRLLGQVTQFVRQPVLPKQVVAIVEVSAVGDGCPHANDELYVVRSRSRGGEA